MTNNRKMASKPPAKKYKYCTCKPLNSTLRPIPLLILYSITVYITGRKNAGRSLRQSGKHRLQTRSRRFFRYRGRLMRTWNKLLSLRLTRRWLLRHISTSWRDQNSWKAWMWPLLYRHFRPLRHRHSGWKQLFMR